MLFSRRNCAHRDRRWRSRSLRWYPMRAEVRVWNRKASPRPRRRERESFPFRCREKSHLFWNTCFLLLFSLYEKITMFVSANSTQVETGSEHIQHSSTPPPKPPVSQRSMSQRSGSLSRQSTADSDTDSALGSTVGPEPIRKSPREYIIPISVEGGGYVTPRSGSLEPESKTSTPTSANPPRSRFGRPRRMGSLLSDASEDESPFSSLHR